MSTKAQLGGQDGIWRGICELSCTHAGSRCSGPGAWHELSSWRGLSLSGGTDPLPLWPHTDAVPASGSSAGGGWERERSQWPMLCYEAFWHKGRCAAPVLLARYLCFQHPRSEDHTAHATTLRTSSYDNIPGPGPELSRERRKIKQGAEDERF